MFIIKLFAIGILASPFALPVYALLQNGRGPIIGVSPNTTFHQKCDVETPLAFHNETNSDSSE